MKVYAMQGIPMKVYRSERLNCFFGKWKEGGGSTGTPPVWKMKLAPTSIKEREEAERYLLEWKNTNGEFSTKGERDPEKVNGKEASAALTAVPCTRLIILPAERTVRTLLPVWREWKNNPKHFSGAFDTWILPHPIADIPLSDLSPAHCVDWIEALKSGDINNFDSSAKSWKDGRDKKRKPNTVRNIVQVLRGFITDCRGKGWAGKCSGDHALPSNMRQNPFLDPFVRKQQEFKGAHKYPVVHLTLEQVRQLMSGRCNTTAVQRGAPAYQFNRTLYILAVTSGLRAAELQGLAWDAIDLEKGIIEVRRQLISVKSTGHDSKETMEKFTAPKRGRARSLPLHSFAMAALREWRGTAVSPVDREISPASPVFPNSLGHYHKWDMARQFRDDLKLAGLSDSYIDPANGNSHHFTFHALRRTFLTLLVEQGVELHLVSRLAGHAAKGVTEAHYIGGNSVGLMKRLREAIESIDLSSNQSPPTECRAGCIPPTRAQE